MRPPVLRTASIRGEGIAEFADAVEAHARSAAPEGTRGQQVSARRRVQRLLSTIAAERVRRALHEVEDQRLADICEAVLKGELSFTEGAERGLELFHLQTAPEPH